MILAWKEPCKLILKSFSGLRGSLSLSLTEQIQHEVMASIMIGFHPASLYRKKIKGAAILGNAPEPCPVAVLR